MDFMKGIKKIPKQKQVKSKDYLPAGLYPIVSQEAELISGYWNDKTYLYKTEKPIVVFGDHTKVVKYIDFDFVVGADGTQLLKPIDALSPKFFYYFLLSVKLRNLGYARHFKLLKQVSIPLPPLGAGSARTMGEPRNPREPVSQIGGERFCRREIGDAAAGTRYGGLRPA